MQPQLVLVEDKHDLATSLANGFREEQFSVTIADTADAGLHALRSFAVDLAILDLGLPDRDGMEVLCSARAAGLALPILVLTARDAVSSRVAALEAGADDYLIKPFSFSELLARVRALIRRAAAPRWAPLTLARLQLHAGEPDVRVAGRSVRLSPRERALLEFMIRRCGQLVTRPDLLASVFGYDFDPGTNLVDVHMAHLRRKIRGGGAAIETVRGFGYRMTLASDA